MIKNKTKLYIILGIIFVIIFSVLFSIPFIRFIEDPEKLRAYITSFDAFAPIIYTLLVCIQILIPFIPGEVFELIAGYTFEGIRGTIYCFIAEAIGTILVILLVKKYGRKLFNVFFNDETIEKLKFLSSKKAFIIFSILFIIPGTSKDLFCYVGALCDFKTIPLILVTTLGRLPAILASTITADAIGDKKYALAIILIIINLTLSLIGVFVYKKLNKKH